MTTCPAWHLIPLLAESEPNQLKDLNGLFINLLGTKYAVLAMVGYGIFVVFGLWRK